EEGVADRGDKVKRKKVLPIVETKWARVRVFCWGEVGKVVGVVGYGGEAAGKGGSGVVAMAGKKKRSLSL
nr:hypothetical protein [Tanacetum cinerariifolium]